MLALRGEGRSGPPPPPGHSGGLRVLRVAHGVSKAAGEEQRGGLMLGED